MSPPKKQISRVILKQAGKDYAKQLLRTRRKEAENNLSRPRQQGCSSAIREEPEISQKPNETKSANKSSDADNPTPYVELEKEFFDPLPLEIKVDEAEVDSLLGTKPIESRPSKVKKVSRQVSYTPGKPLILFIGHSWVRRLGEHASSRPRDVDYLLHNFELEFQHESSLRRAVIGKAELKNRNRFPSVIFLHLGGNDLDNETPFQMVKQDLKTFVAALKSTYPRVKIVVSQIEPRFPEEYMPNHFCPPSTKLLSFQQKSGYFNSFLRTNKSIGQDRVFVVQGNSALTDRLLYCRDGVHLNRQGEITWVGLITSFFRKTFPCSNIPVGLPPLLVYCESPRACNSCYDMRWKEESNN